MTVDDQEVNIENIKKNISVLEENLVISKRKLESAKSKLKEAKFKASYLSWMKMEGKHYRINEKWHKREACYRKVLSVNNRNMREIIINYTDISMSGHTYTIKRAEIRFLDEKKLEERPFKYEKEVTEDEYAEVLKKFILHSGAVTRDKLGHDFLKFSPYYLSLKKLTDAVKKQDSVYFTDEEMDALEFPEEIKKRMIEVDHVIYYCDDRMVWVVPMMPIINTWNKFY